jgi:hypothetical protein
MRIGNCGIEARKCVCISCQEVKICRAAVALFCAGVKGRHPDRVRAEFFSNRGMFDVVYEDVAPGTTAVEAEKFRRVVEKMRERLALVPPPSGAGA